MGTTKHLVYQEIMNKGIYDKFIEFAAYMYFTCGMSFFNSALVILQRPGAVCVKTEYAWLRDYGRTLKPGVTPIVIMKIGGPVSFVYDISDTAGKNAPVRLRNILKEHEVITPLGKMYADMQRTVNAAGIYYSECPMGTLQHGEAKCEFPSVLPIEYNGRRLTTHYSVTINSTDSDTNKAAAIIHELAHIFCGHLPCADKKFMKTLKIPNRSALDGNTKEYEAEKTVEFICKTMGFDYDAEIYLQSYDTQNVDKALSESYILDSSQRLIEIMLKAGIDPHLVADEENGFEKEFGDHI